MSRNKLGVISGMESAAGGIGFILGTPSVWGYALVPVTILVLLACGLCGVGIWGAGRATDALLGKELSVWGHVGGWLLTVLFALVAMVLAVLLALVLAQPFSGFALEAIVLAQERALTGSAPHPPPFLTALAGSFKVVLVTLLAGGPVLALLFTVSLAFPAAAVVTVPLKVLVGAWLLAWDFLDYPLGVRGLGILARLGWVGRNFGAFSAFGLTWALMLLIPGIFFFVLPMGVAGATRLVIAEERLRRPRRIRRGRDEDALWVEPA